MSARSSVTAIVLVSGVALSSCTAALRAQRTTSASEPAAAEVDRFFARWSTPRSPGCAVGVARDGRDVLLRAYGMANLEYGVPNTPETIFESGSVAKQFTAAAVALLAKQGKLSLDDDVRKYFPELPDYGAPIRIRHMLNHTSGLRDWGTMAAAEGWPRGSRSHTQADALGIIARQKSLNFPPGSEYLYSNSNYTLAAILVARVSGVSFAEFTRTHIFEPLGMSNSSWRDDYTRVVRNRATAYARDGDGAWHMNMPFENAHGHGGMLTTVADLLRWNQNFVDTIVGGGWLSSELIRRGKLNGGSEIRYALGLTVDRYRGVPQVSHSGATAAYRAYLVRYPEQRLGLALLCNAADVPTGRIIHQIADLYLGLPSAEVESAPANGIALSESQLIAKTGLYRSLRDNTSLTLTVRDGALHLEDGPSLAPLSSTTFQVDEGPDRLIFLTDAGGRPRELLVPGADGDTTRFVPVPRWAPDAAELHQYVGEYASEEAKATYVVKVADGALMVQGPRGRALALSPTWRDAFLSSATGYVVRFHRDARGRVAGLGIGFGRARDVRFRKTK